jgi:type II secretory pathway component PulM
MDRVVLSDLQKRSRRNRNIALGVSLALLVVIFYAITIIKMSPGL